MARNPGGMAASAVRLEPATAAADAALHLQHAPARPSCDGAAPGSTPCSTPSQHPVAGAQPSTKPGDGSGTCNRTGAGNNLGGSLKPAIKYRAQKAWRDRQKVQKQQCEHACGSYRGMYLRVLLFGGGAVKSMALSGDVTGRPHSVVHVTLTLQAKAQQTFAQLETLQQDVQQLSVAQVRHRYQQHALLYSVQLCIFPSRATRRLLWFLARKYQQCRWVVGWALHGNAGGLAVRRQMCTPVNRCNWYSSSLQPLLQFPYRSSWKGRMRRWNAQCSCPRLLPIARRRRCKQLRMGSRMQLQGGRHPRRDTSPPHGGLTPAPRCEPRVCSTAIFLNEAIASKWLW